MTKHTQAHLTRTVSRNQPSAVLEKTQSQMEYYMGAKLVEMGVDPKSAMLGTVTTCAFVPRVII